MSKKVDIVEIKTEPNESVELFSDGENTNMFDNHSRQDGSKIYPSILS